MEGIVAVYFEVQTRYGIMNLENNRPKEPAYFGFCFICVFGITLGLLCLIGSIVVGEVILFLCGLPWAGLGVYFVTVIKKYSELWWELKKKYEVKKEKENKLQFYKMCKERGVVNMKSQTARDKVKSIAEQLDILESDLESYFEEANAFGKKQELVEMKKNERQAQSALTRYANLVGRRKKNAMLRDMIALKNAEKDELFSPVFDSERAKKREHDWAIHGGIASGIAGPIAGLAAAVDVINKNAEIRENNAKLTELQFKYLGAVSGQVRRIEREIEELEGEISSCKKKVISKTEGEEIMNNLTIVSKEIAISETGSFLIKASVKCKSEVKIKDKISGVVDGTIAADLYQKDKLVGTALMTLPLDGVGCSAVGVEGIGLGKAKCGVDYKLIYRPHNLWEIEK